MSLKTCSVLAVSILLLVSCGDDESKTRADAQATLDRAWQSYFRRNFSNALLDFERAARLDPALADAHNGIGWAHLSLVEGSPSPQVLERAVQSFARALREDGKLADAWVGLGQALFLRRSKPEDFQDAARALASAREADPATLYRHDYQSPADIYALEGWCYYYAGDHDAARERAQRALSLNPNTPAARLLDGLVR